MPDWCGLPRAAGPWPLGQPAAAAAEAAPGVRCAKPAGAAVQREGRTRQAPVPFPWRSVDRAQDDSRAGPHCGGAAAAVGSAPRTARRDLRQLSRSLARSSLIGTKGRDQAGDISTWTAARAIRIELCALRPRRCLASVERSWQKTSWPSDPWLQRRCVLPAQTLPNTAQIWRNFSCLVTQSSSADTVGAAPIVATQSGPTP